MRRYSVFLIPSLSLFILGMAAGYSLFVPLPDSPFENYREEVRVEGVVIRDPEIREGSTRVVLETKKINGEKIEAGERVLVFTDPYVSVSYGDVVEARGMIKKPESFITDTGRVFNYPMFLRAEGIGYTVSFATVRVIARDEGGKIFSFLIGIKHQLVRGIENALPEPHAALAMGLLLGEKQSLGDELYQLFITSGLVHIIVLSGYNVSLVIYAVLYVTLSFLPRLFAYGCALLFVIAFAILTGASDTTIRASIMAVIMIIARLLHRPTVALHALSIAAAGMAIVNPYLVLYDLSFQLSVLATLGLIVFSDRVSSLFSFIPKKNMFREIASSTLATQITVTPLLLFSIGTVSLVFLPANMLVLPLIPLAMFFSFVAGVAGIIYEPLALVWGYISFIPLSYIIFVAEFFGGLPSASVTFSPDAGAGGGALLGAVVVATLLYIAWKSPPRSDS